jgi:hypothetical protein
MFQILGAFCFNFLEHSLSTFGDFLFQLFYGVMIQFLGEILFVAWRSEVYRLSSVMFQGKRLTVAPWTRTVANISISGSRIQTLMCRSKEHLS